MIAQKQNNIAFEDVLQIELLKLLLADKLITSAEYELILEDLKKS